MLLNNYIGTKAAWEVYCVFINRKKQGNLFAVGKIPHIWSDNTYVLAQPFGGLSEPVNVASHCARLFMIYALFRYTPFGPPRSEEA